MFEIATQTGAAGEGVSFIQALEKEASRAIRPLPVNVDGAIAAVLYDLGFEASYARLFFILGRVVGISAHVMEEITCEKPMRIKIPVVYKDPD